MECRTRVTSLWQLAWLQTVGVVVSIFSWHCQRQCIICIFFLYLKGTLKTMLRYLYLLSLPYKLIRDVLKRIQDKGMVSKDLFQGKFRWKEEISCLDDQWFSGFQECSSTWRGQQSTIQTLWFFKMTKREASTGRRKMGLEIWFGKRNKRREGVTRLIKLFHQSNSRIYKFKFYSSFNTFIKTINLCT